MIARDETFAIRRILVALDAATASTELLEEAVDIARRMEAEIEGLFVEDANLMRLAELPFAQELTFPSGLLQQLDLASVERNMRALAAHAREALEGRAQELNVRCSFRVVRGPLKNELSAAAETADLVVLNRVGGALTRHVRLESGAELAAMDVPRPVLLLRGRQAAIRSMTLAFDATPGADHALAAAAHLKSRIRATGEADGAGLVVLCLGSTETAARQAEKKARSALEQQGIAATFRLCAGAAASDLRGALRSAADVLLILPAELPFLATEAGLRLLTESDGPVLLVR